MKDIVLILAHKRPEALQACLERVHTYAPDKEIWVCLDVHKDIPQTDAEKEIASIASKYPVYNLVINEHNTSGNAYNTRESLRLAAAELSVRYIYLIEDDITVAQDFFEWSLRVHTKFHPHIVAGFHRPADLCNDGDPSDCVQNSEFVHSFALSFRPEVVELLLPYLTKPLDVVLNGPDRHKRKIITPLRSRCSHPGLGELPNFKPWTDVRLSVPKLLIAVESCQRDLMDGHHRRIRKEWAKGLDADVRFFVGGEKPAYELQPDEIWLDVPDAYLDLPKKTRAISAWMLEQDYSHMMKVDVDTIVIEREFNSFPYQRYDYAGFFWSPIDSPGSAASGFCYFLSRKACKLVAEFNYRDAREVSQWAEDQMVGDALREGIKSLAIKAVHIPRRVASGVAGRGQPHEPECPYPPGTCEIIIKGPGLEPVTKVLPREKALWYLRTGLAKLVWPKEL